MTAVSDTSPICYLILIDEISVLPGLFNDVLVPQAVLAELRHADAPEAVRKWSFSPPSWIGVKEGSAPTTTGMEKLQAGEQAAILLAQLVKANVILLDEKSARQVAVDRGLQVTGTLGILGEASARGLVDLTAAIKRLRTTNFRYSPALLKATLDRFAGR